MSTQPTDYTKTGDVLMWTFFVFCVGVLVGLLIGSNNPAIIKRNRRSLEKVGAKITEALRRTPQ